MLLLHWIRKYYRCFALSCFLTELLWWNVSAVFYIRIENLLYEKWRMDSASRCVVCMWEWLTCPVQRPTTRSAIKVSSVSPERWLTITPQPFSWASLHLRAGGAQIWCMLSHRCMCMDASANFCASIYTQKSTHALMASVTEPIWLTFSSRQLQAFSSTARCILRGLVTVKSSPTTCAIYTTELRTDLSAFCYSQ